MTRCEHRGIACSSHRYTQPSETIRIPWEFLLSTSLSLVNSLSLSLVNSLHLQSVECCIRPVLSSSEDKLGRGVCYCWQTWRSRVRRHWHHSWKRKSPFSETLMHRDAQTFLSYDKARTPTTTGGRLFIWSRQRQFPRWFLWMKDIGEALFSTFLMRSTFLDYQEQTTLGSEMTPRCDYNLLSET